MLGINQKLKNSFMENNQNTDENYNSFYSELKKLLVEVNYKKPLYLQKMNCHFQKYCFK